jgi:hypothetical protein
MRLVSGRLCLSDIIIGSGECKRNAKKFKSVTQNEILM